MKFLNWLIALAAVMILSACGGGGSSGGNSLFSGGSASTTATTLTTKLVLSSNVVSLATPITATATVTNASGVGVSGVTVAFALAGGNVASLSSPSVSTDASGVATVLLTALSGTVVGDDTLSAVATSGTVSSAKSTALFSANSAATIEMLSSSNTAASSGDEITITAIVKSGGGVGLSGAPVTFTTDTGTLKSPAAKTDATGVATVKFTSGADKTNRSAIVTSTSGKSSSTLKIPITGSSLSISGATTVAFNGKSLFTIKATDDKGSAIANATLTLKSSLANGLAASTVVTDAQGQASVSYTASNPGTDTLSVAGLGTTASVAVTISSVDFAFSSPAANTQIAVGTPQVVQVRYRQSGLGVSGQVVNFATTGGVLSAATGVTDANGLVQVSIQSTSAAPATVQASLANGSASATVPLSFVATVPNRLVLQASPTAIGPNAVGSTSNQAQVVAKVSDLNGNPVPGLTVNFSRDADPSGGDLLQGSAKTDANGQATVQYLSGAQSTSSNGVVLRGSVSGTSVTGTVTLTVSQSALFLALGTGNVITNVDPQTYKKDWTVYVTDANGVAVPNVNITAKIIPVYYRKGQLKYLSSLGSWNAILWDGTSVSLDDTGAPILPAGSYLSCANEDAFYGDLDPRSYNGILNSGEDANGNSKLEPGNVIALTTSSGSLKTDTSGRATISLVYAESYVPWVVVKLQVQAIVSGTASITDATFTIDGAAEDFITATTPPAAVLSPFGARTSCSDPL